MLRLSLCMGHPSQCHNSTRCEVFCSVFSFVKPERHNVDTSICHFSVDSSARQVSLNYRTELPVTLISSVYQFYI